MASQTRFSAQFAVVGASNVTRGLASIVAAMSRSAPGPFRAGIATGLGRSYGLESSILARGLPSILGCRLWRHLNEWRRESPDVPCYALVADVGNDVAYGVATESIGRWFEECLVRLAELGFPVVTTGLPVESLRRLGRTRFAILQRLFFPERALEYDDALRRIWAIDEWVREIAAERSVSCSRLPGEWYGLDPIHIRRRLQPVAWRTITHAWGETRSEPGTRLRRYTYAMRPEHWSWAGEPRTTRQPTVLSDGSELWLW